ncbi:MAG: hypothetical protein O6840_01180 [Nitrospirae bacterium]|nr:hypothetical protein [Nitrospirota bacterium]
MNMTYTDTSIWVLGAAFAIAGLPFLALYLRDAFHSRAKSPKKDRMTSVASTLVGTTFGMMVFLTPLVPVSAQELFALSTETGLEFYQVDTVKQPTWPLNRHSSALWPEPQTFLLIPSVEVETIKLFNSPLMVLPGFTTTTTGRVLTTAGRIHWLSTPPSVEMVQVLDSPSLIAETIGITTATQHVAQQNVLGVHHSNSN